MRRRNKSFMLTRALLPAVGLSVIILAPCRAAIVLAFFLAVTVSASPAQAITSNDEGPEASVTLYDSGTGNLGINARKATSLLDAHLGEVRVGDSGAACAQANEGAIRYAKPALEFCNGTDWQVLSIARRAQ